MLPVLLTMVMAQVDVLPASPWKVVGPPAPIVVTDEPSIVWDGMTFQVAWLDRRRSPGREFLADPVDLWMASVGPSTGFGRPVALSATRDRVSSLRLVASGSNLVAVRRLSTGTLAVSDYETLFLGGFFSTWMALQPIPSPSPALVALNGTTGVVLTRVNSTRVAGGAFWPDAGSSPVGGANEGSSLTSIAASGTGFIYATNRSTGVFIDRLLGSGGGQQLDPNTTGASVVAGPGMEYAVAFSPGQLGVYDVDGGAVVTQWPVNQPPMTQASSSFGRDWAFGWSSASATIYRAFRGPDAGPFLSLSDAGAVTSMALGSSNPNVGVLSAIERFPSGYGVRQMPFSGTSPTLSPGTLRMLMAPSPLRTPSVVWSPSGFLVSFDQRDGGAAQVALSPANPASPAPTPLGSGGLSSVQLGRTNAGLFSLNRPTGTSHTVLLQSGMQVTTNFGFGSTSQATGGAESIIVWAPSASPLSYQILQLDGGAGLTMASSLPTPSCFGVSGDRYLLFDPSNPAIHFLASPISGTQLLMGAVPILPANRARVCTAVAVPGPNNAVTGAAYRRVDDTLAVVTAAGGFVVGDGRDAGPPITGDPLLVPFGPGFLAAAIAAPDGRLRFFTVTPRGELAPIPQADTEPGVVDFSLADSPDAGLAAAAWQWFDEDAGAMVVGARVFRFPPTTGADAGPGPDAGVVDAGLMDAGVIDAGLMDAGLMDAGLIDAGLMDAGLIDSGVVDAGLIDAGLLDAGSLDAATADSGVAGERGTIIFVPTGCGCTSASLPPFLILGLMLLARRSRRT